MHSRYISQKMTLALCENRQICKILYKFKIKFKICNIHYNILIKMDYIIYRVISEEEQFVLSVKSIGCVVI